MTAALLLYAFVFLVGVAGVVILVITGHPFWAALVFLLVASAEIRVR